ncbi:hypothetical protein Tco_1368761 [Tanacetum coccineum]
MHVFFSKPRTQDNGCGYFMWKDDLKIHLSSSPGPSTLPKCSNCKFLVEKIKILEAKIKILEGTLEMEKHPENHTLASATILHELDNDMGKLGLE